MSPQNRYIDVNGIRTRYWEGGTGDPVVLVHGLGASIETWQDIWSSLVSHKHALALDLVGFGYTEKPEIDYTHRLLTNFLLAFLDMREVNNAALVGHSLGGSLVLRLALEHPDRVHSLILADSAGLRPDIPLGLRLLSLPLIGELLLRPDRDKTRRSLEPFFYDQAGLSDDFIDLNYDLITQSGAQRAYLSTVRNMTTIFGMRSEVVAATVARLGEVTQKTLMLWGAQDQIVPVDQARSAVDALPHAELQIIDQCGHLPMLEQSNIFVERVVEFLET